MSKKQYAATDFDRYSGLGKSDIEKRIITDILQRLGLQNFQVRSGDRPDALVDFSTDNQLFRVGCEVQTLHSDDTGQGSELRRFRERWRRIMDQVLASLLDKGTVPYCRVDFLNPSYRCLQGYSDASLIKEFSEAGNVLLTTSDIQFPKSGMPTLSKLLRQIEVIDPDGAGLLWWPSHMQSGIVPPIDDAIIEAIRTKTKRASGYDWQDVSERWLLLAALGHGLTDSVGTARQINLPGMLTECPFTLVIIWDKRSEDVWTVFPQFKLLCDGERQKRNVSALPHSIQIFSTGSETYPTRAKVR